MKIAQGLGVEEVTVYTVWGGLDAGLPLTAGSVSKRGTAAERDNDTECQQRQDAEGPAQNCCDEGYGNPAYSRSPDPIRIGKTSKNIFLL